jgi:YHS domain-containing protein
MLKTLRFPEYIALAGTLCLLTALALTAGFADAAGETHPSSGHSQHQQESLKSGPAPYPLVTCPITGQKLGSMGAPLSRTYGNREVRFCCAGCPAQFEKNLKANLLKLDKAIAADQKPDYPLRTCLVTGEKLGGSMGKVIDEVVGNRFVRLCCPSCLGSIEKNPAKYMKQLDQAVIKQQGSKYPLDVCVVDGEQLGDHTVDHVFGGSLVRLHNEACLEQFSKNPANYLDPPDAMAHDDEAAEVWTCPMHPEIQEPEAGKCPKCGMDLVLASEDGATGMGMGSMMGSCCGKKQMKMAKKSGNGHRMMGMMGMHGGR